MSNIEIVARWIIEECDNPLEEIEWLLGENYGASTTQLDFDYHAIINAKRKESEVKNESEI